MPGKIINCYVGLQSCDAHHLKMAAQNACQFLHKLVYPRKYTSNPSKAGFLMIVIIKWWYIDGWDDGNDGGFEVDFFI